MTARHAPWLALAALATLASPAGAATSVRSGWWTSAPVALAPDVGEDRLLVQGGADPARPLAYAALSFALDPGEAPASIELVVAPESGTTPGATLVLCALTAPATEAQGAPAAEGPPFDCSITVDAAPSGAGTYVADLAPFPTDGALDVALLPARPADRIVLERPGVDALRGGRAGAPVTDTSTPIAPVEGSSPGPLPALGGTFGTGAFDAPAPVVPAVAATPPASIAAGSRPEVQLAAPTASAAVGGSDGRSLRPFLFAALVAGCGALWLTAGQARGAEDG